MKASSSTIFITAATATVLMAVIAGLAVIGSPESARVRRLDELRAQDLQQMANAIRSYRSAYGALPETLERVLADGRWSFLRVRDVETRLPYEYHLLDMSSYELCAHFAASSDETYSGPFPEEAFWRHPAGRHCYRLQAPAPPQEATSPR